jgi:hypothetical protein
MDSSVSIVTGQRVGGMVHQFLIHWQGGVLCFFTDLGLRYDAFKNICNLRIWFADSHSNSVSMLRVGQPGF